MISIKTFTATDMEAAKAAGFKTKKPKKGKAKKTQKAIDAYVVRYNAWVDKLKIKAKAGKTKVAAKKALEANKAKIAAL